MSEGIVIDAISEGTQENGFTIDCGILRILPTVRTTLVLH